VLTVVVGAGVFGSAEDALGEWRDGVGPAASGASLSPCTAGLPALLLAPCLQTGVIAEMLQGSEPRELIREYYRMRRRARALVGFADAAAGSASFGADDAYDAFTAWYTTGHDDALKPAAPDLILSEWGPGTYPDERSFYACSPHRIEMAARLIRDGYFPDEANAALELLPEWTQWCLERSGLDGDAADRSRRAARSAAAASASDEAAERGDEGPFRRRE
jgi:hypothetical protein